jgi:hypothetical protein
MSEWRELLNEYGATLVISANSETSHRAGNVAYIPVGDYLLPALKLQDVPAGKKNRSLGRYARLRRAYLREHRPIEYNKLLMSERIFPHLWEIDEAAASRLAVIGNAEIAHEVILSELVYD